MHDAVRQNAATPRLDGADARSQGACLHEGIGAGRRPLGPVGWNCRRIDQPSAWAGKGDGIRGPEIDETPLSAEEVRFVRGK
jgi:hypothetical protein